MIARYGPRTRIPDARSRAELADAARPLRYRKGRRDSDPASRGRGAQPHQHPASPDLARPGSAQRTEQAAASPAAPAAAGVTPNPAALARPTHHPPLDLPAPTTRSTTHRTTDPSPGTAHGPRESPLGLQTNSGPFRGRLDRLEDHKERGTRSRATTGRSDLARVPRRAGRSDPRDRFRSRRHRLPAPPLRPRGGRARPSPRTSPGSPPTRPGPGLPSRPATCSWTSAIAPTGSDS